MNEFLTLDFLATFAGLTAATSLVVQFTKSILKKKFGDEVVRIYTFTIAAILTFIFANSGSGPANTILTLLNSIVISLSAMGAYEVVADPKAKKSR